MGSAEPSEDELLLLRQIYDGLRRWDVEALRTLVAHDIEWHLPESLPWGGTRHGADGIEVIADVFQEHIEGSWADPDDFLDAGDRIVVLGRFRGRARSSGQDYEVPFAHVWGMSEGVPSSFRAYFDASVVVAALKGEKGPDIV